MSGLLSRQKDLTNVAHVECPQILVIYYSFLGKFIRFHLAQEPDSLHSPPQNCIHQRRPLPIDLQEVYEDHQGATGTLICILRPSDAASLTQHLATLFVISSTNESGVTTKL